MLTILVLFVGLTLATAVIAYWSDNLGKKLGKKRVSLWGMRPRTTATFLTIASSWLIMIFTLGVMLTLFKPLRQALLRYDEVRANETTLKKSKTQLTGQVNDLGGQLTALQSQTQTLESQVKRAAENLGVANDKLKLARDSAKKAREASKTARREADAAKQSAQTYLKREQSAVKRESAALKNLDKVTQQRDATQQQRATAQRQLTAAQTDLKRASADVKTANRRVQSANARVRAAQVEVDQAEAQFGQAQAELARVQADLGKARTSEERAKTNAATANRGAEVARQNAEKSRLAAVEAEKRVATASESVVSAGRKVLEADKQVIAADQRVAQAEKRVAQLQRQSAELAEANRQVLDANGIILASNIRVPVGRTLVARSFDSSVSSEQTTEALRALFARAADQIVPGLLPGATLELASRQVVARKEKPGDPDVLVVLKDSEIYRELATAISRSQNPLSVRLVSDRNHLEGEEALEARFIVVPIRPALPAAEELASAVFDPKSGDARLFSALLELVETGREVATRNGVTPPLSPELPDFYAPGSNQQLFETLRQITAHDGPARVTLVTAAPISTADQLSVRFQVEPASTTARAPAKRGIAKRGAAPA